MVFVLINKISWFKSSKQYRKTIRDLETKLAYLQCALDGANDKLLYCGGNDFLPDYDCEYGREQLNALHRANRYAVLDEAKIKIEAKYLDVPDNIDAHTNRIIWYNDGIQSACKVIDEMMNQLLVEEKNQTME